MNFELYGAGPVGGLAVISLVLAGAFAFVGSHARGIRGLHAVALAYAFNALRFLLVAWAPFASTGANRLCADLANVAGSALLVYGALQLAGMRRRALPAGLGAAGAAFAMWAASQGIERVFALIATSLLGAAAQGVFAWALYRLARKSRLVGYCIAASMAAALVVVRLLLPAFVELHLQAFAVMMAGVLYVGTAVALVGALQSSQLAEIASMRKEAVEAQRFAKVLFHHTADLMAIARVAPDGRFIMERANGSLLAALRASHPDRRLDVRAGRDLEEMLRADLALPGDAVDRIMASFHEAVRSGAVQSIRGAFGLRRQDAVLTPIHDAAGAVVRVFYRGADVTESHAAQDALRRSHERFEAILENATVAITITRLDDGVYLYANPAWCRLAACRLDDVLGRSATELGLWTAADRKRELLERLGPDGAAQVERTYANLEGRRVDTVLSVQTIEFDGEKCLLSIAQDVTAQNEARQRATELSERFTHLFSSSPVPIVVTRVQDGRYLEVNDAWLRLYELTREQVIGRSTTDFGVWPSAAERRAMVEILERDGVLEGYPNHIRRESDNPRDVLLWGRTLNWDGERAVVGFEMDVTDANRSKLEIERLNASLEDRVRERTSELEQALSEVEGFTYTVSHDLRAPLRAMTSFSDLLMRRAAAGDHVQAADYAGRVSRAASKMGRMVDALLRYARLAREPMELHKLALCSETALLAAELDAEHPGRRIQWQFGTMPEVRADRRLLRMALRGYMENAVKFTAERDDARIEVSAALVEDEVQVAVRDNGEGFDMAFADKLFAPFQRLHDESRYEGIGIGLADARRVVERHGGRVWCNSAPGKGATFAFSLPR